MQANNRTYLAKKETVKPEWYLIDASGKILGRLAVKLATILMGKHHPIYTPYVDTGAFIVVTNAEKIKISGKKAEEKIYKRYTNYSDGQKETTYQTMKEQSPDQIIVLAVKRMLPQTKMGDHMLKKLKVYAGAEHPHKAQNPKPLEI